MIQISAEGTKYWMKTLARVFSGLRKKNAQTHISGMSFLRKEGLWPWEPWEVEVGECSDVEDIVSRGYYKLLKGRRSFSFKTRKRALLGDIKGREIGSVDRWWEQTQTGAFRKISKREISDSHILLGSGWKLSTKPIWQGAWWSLGLGKKINSSLWKPRYRQKAS